MTLMHQRLFLLPALVLLATCRDEKPTEPVPVNPQSVSVLTQHNDNTRAGLNDNETVLTTTNVNVQQFGEVFTVNVDDQVYAQPLVVGGLTIGDGTSNVVFVATVNNTVYAFNGDNGHVYWQKNYTAAGMRPPRNTDMTGACGGGYQDFSGNIGIVGTPVIDAVHGTMYFVARSTNGSSYVQHLHAVNILDGNEVAGPTLITATYAGTGDGNVGGVITFNAQRANQRSALTLVNGRVYVSFSSHCDWGPYHGWILGYDATTLQREIVYNDTPDGYAGGMWESGMGMSADADGNLYVVSGNGTVGVDADPTDPRNRAESALKLTPSGSTLTVSSYFTPNNFTFLNDYDLDYGGTGAFLIPNSNYFVTGAKDGRLFLLNKDAMGGWHNGVDEVQQSMTIDAGSEMHCHPAYYHGSAAELVYIWPENAPLRAIPFDRGSNLLVRASETISTAAGPTGHSGALLTVSSNGTQDGTGILWAAFASSGDAEHDVSPGILRAFDASDVTHELWNNRQNAARDIAGTYAKFASPTVANGHVYLPTFNNRIVVYGLQ